MAAAMSRGMQRQLLLPPIYGVRATASSSSLTPPLVV